ncbi:secreted RxLR effector protein 161-like [Rosa chinensis]|uniref:secreted RxLR effector protein 161-like n=1 Tax=Rosa chinensis TaxID=74649 RepID=UPI001AD925A9|nr:secreted RxLR effector protein 161-like [Rosa chinensis]
MENSNAVKNPIVPGTKLTKDKAGVKVDSTMFKQVVGSLMYLTATRPDLMYGVSLISRFMSCPTMSHWLAAKRILRYVRGTTELGIFYKKGGRTDLVAYIDSDFASDLDDRRSTSGFVFSLGFGAVSWSSKKQHVVTLSTTEAEYIAVAFCACQCVWLRRVLEKLGLKEKKSIVIQCDNNSTIQLSKNPVFHGRCKHINVRFHFLRDLVKDGVVKLSNCNSQIQVAYIMTKPLKLEQFLRLRSMLGMIEASEVK